MFAILKELFAIQCFAFLCILLFNLDFIKFSIQIEGIFITKFELEKVMKFTLKFKNSSNTQKKGFIFTVIFWCILLGYLYFINFLCN